MSTGGSCWFKLSIVIGLLGAHAMNGDSLKALVAASRISPSNMWKPCQPFDTENNLDFLPLRFFFRAEYSLIEVLRYWHLCISNSIAAPRGQLRNNQTIPLWKTSRLSCKFAYHQKHLPIAPTSTKKHCRLRCCCESASRKQSQAFPVFIRGQYKACEDWFLDALSQQ